MMQAAARLDLAAIRSHFPSLRSGTAHFDGPGGTQTPDVVARAIHDTLVAPLSNRGSLTEGERNADLAVRSGRAALADLLGTEPSGIIFGRSMTQLTMDLARTLAKRWGPGDEIVVTRLDHDANVRSWVLAARQVGASVHFADFDPATGELDPAEIARHLTPATRLVAVTAASNLIGTMPDVRAIADLVHAAGAQLFVDGVHYAAHAVVDVEGLGADYFACSPYKLLGPHCGAIHGRPELLEQLEPDKLLPAPDHVPERFELGTLPYELLAGTAAAVDFLASLAPVPGATRRDRLVATMTALEAHEERLRSRIERAVLSLPGVTLHSRAARRTPTLLVTFAGCDPRAVQAFLAERRISAPAGSFYAHEAARCLGLGATGGLRIGLAPYVDDEDVDRLIEALGQFPFPGR